MPVDDNFGDGDDDDDDDDDDDVDDDDGSTSLFFLVHCSSPLATYLLNTSNQYGQSVCFLGEECLTRRRGECSLAAILRSLQCI